MTQVNSAAAVPDPLKPAEPDNLVLQARDVHFDWSATPLHWIPGQPFATHMINSLQMLLPAGEEWFVRVFKEALPLIKDDRLREDVLGFIGQEAMHARSHSEVLDHLKAQGLDPTPYVNQAEWLFERLLGDRDLTGKAREEWLIERLSLIAGIEHFTAVLGQWVLDAKGLEEAGADAMMLDLLRWHGAEEVEHRSVAFDVYQHVDGRYSRRLRTAAIVDPALVWLILRGTRFLMVNDPQRRGRRAPWPLAWHRAAKRGLLPAPGQLARAALRYIAVSYHPSQEGSTSQAVAYLATSPAAQAAEQATGHTAA